MKTDITMVLDRSGSMGSIKNDVIGGINEFLKTQKEIDSECVFTLRQFDNEHETVYNAQDINTIEPLTDSTFVPRGLTALYDAICIAIDATGKRLAEMHSDDRPDNVMFVIMTDGYENASKEFSMSDVNTKISHQKDKYNWDFTFMGANQDAIAAGQQFGIDAAKSLTFAANSVGSTAAFDSMNAYYSNVRSCNVSAKASAFSDEDRLKQTQAGA